MVERDSRQPRLAILTSGGDAPGMNPAVRAVARTGLDAGADVWGVLEGYRGLVAGGDALRPLSWDEVGGILHRGGTLLGTARSPEFRTVEGRQRAVRHLLERGIDRLVVIGGDGSLYAADMLWREWRDHVAALQASGQIAPDLAERHSHLVVAGLVGSIDNDMVGTDMTIGADTALHRITEALDAIGSTATSHQRTFVVEVMGRRCGYLALMSAISAGADWVLLPEDPPEHEDWQRMMCDRLRAGRKAGRRDSIVVVSEGAQDRHGQPITAVGVKETLERELGEEVRLTILGHVQRGGSPSAFDRYMSTVLGAAAVREVLAASPGDPPQLIGMRNNRVTRTPLGECVSATRDLAQALDEHRHADALTLRGGSFAESLQTLGTLVKALPKPPAPEQRRLRLAVLTAGGPAPGMNTAVRAAVRVGLDQGHVMLGVRNGFLGLVEDEIDEMGWMSVRGWTSAGGSELGTNRHVPTGSDLYALARTLEAREVDGLMVVGGWSAYEAVHRLYCERDKYPAFNLPILCLPATINNNLPGSEIAIGTDTALNSIVEVVDKIKQSAVASSRCFVVEVMGRYCGFLALMSGLASGAERVYLHEEGLTLADLQADLGHLIAGFQRGKRLGLLIRNEKANPVYTTPFMVSLLEEESGGLFEVRQAILGHLQQGGNPTPFDRIQATRLARRGLEALVAEAERGGSAARFIGLEGGKVRLHDFEDFPRMVDRASQRPKTQWWMDLRPIAAVLAQPGPNGSSAAGP